LPNRTWKGEQARVPISQSGAIHADETDRRTIFLLDDNHVNGPAQGGRIDRVPGLGDRATDAPDVLHPATRGQRARPARIERRGSGVRRIYGRLGAGAVGGSRLWTAHVTTDGRAQGFHSNRPGRRGKERKRERGWRR